MHPTRLRNLLEQMIMVHRCDYLFWLDFPSFLYSICLVGVHELSLIRNVKHIWELPGNYRGFIVVVVFYLFCWRTKRILVTPITDFKVYILIQSLMLFISENNRVICFWNYHGTFIYIYPSRLLYVTVLYFDWAVFIPLILVTFG